MAWPRESLMCLKPSRSKNNIATFLMWRRAKAMAWLTRSLRSMRLGNPVRKSCWAEWAICLRHSSGGAHVAKNDYSTGGPAFPIVDRSHGIFDRNFESVAANKDAVRRQMHRAILPDDHFHGVGDSLAIGSV